MANERNSITIKAILSAALTFLIAGLFFHTVTDDSRLKPGDSTVGSAGLAALGGAFLGIATLMQLNSKHQPAPSSSRENSPLQTIIGAA